MVRRPPSSTRTDTLFPCTTRFRSDALTVIVANREGAITIVALPDAPSGSRVKVEPLRSIGTDGTELIHTPGSVRSEEHTSELQSLMRISYAVFCLKKTTKTATNTDPR